MSIPSCAAAIGEPARARMLYALLDDHARTSTELALIARVTPSTASAHLQRLRAEGLVAVVAQGKHRYYRLGGAEVAAVLEAMSVLNAQKAEPFVATTPEHLRAARTCYDHIAGALGVVLHDRLIAQGWLADYELTRKGSTALAALGVDLDSARAARRRFAFGCMDWSERRPHLGGALGAALLQLHLSKKWVTRNRGDRALTISTAGRRALRAQLGISN
jgi:DNA-binding transcriptional ArsR family regulator